MGVARRPGPVRRRPSQAERPRRARPHLADGAARTIGRLRLPGVPVDPAIDALVATSADLLERVGTPEQKEQWLPDLVAGRVASALRARRLVYMSDVPGLLADPKDPATLISSVPTVLLFIALRKYFMAGLQLGTK